MPCSLKQQQHRRRRVGLVAIAAAASYQVLLPKTIVDRGDRGLAFAGTTGERQMVGLIVLALLLKLFVAAVVIRRSGRNKRVCEKLVSKWRELAKEGEVNRKDFEAGVKKIFTGHNEIGETEISYLYGLINRLDKTPEGGDGTEVIEEVELQSGLKKVMSLIGQKDVETVDDMREVLHKLANAASHEESDAIEAEVKKEMSNKSMVDLDENTSDHREGSAREVDAAEKSGENNPVTSVKSTEGLDQAALEYEETHPVQDQEVNREVEAC